MNTENIEIDESEFFTHDFTTATTWEVFIARLEEVLHEFERQDKKQSSSQNMETYLDWSVLRDNIPFGDSTYAVHLYRNLKSCTTSESECNEKQSSGHIFDINHDFAVDKDPQFPRYVLANWYGLKKFAVVSSPSHSPVLNESQIKTLVSSAYIAAANVDYPIFVQIRHEWQNLYMGACQKNEKTTHFEMVHLQKGPPHCHYLAGLIDLFKTKIMSPVSLDPIVVSEQLTHTLTEFGLHCWKQEFTSECFADQVGVLPFGVTVDPIEALHLKATWRNLHDNLVMDSANFSNFDPMQAPEWSLTASFTEKPASILSDCLYEMLQLRKIQNTMYDVLGDFAAQVDDGKNPFEQLTESKVPSISSVIKSAAQNTRNKQRKGVPPLPEEVLIPVLYLLFPDADTDNVNPYQNEDQDKSQVNSCKIDFRGFKTCAVDSLVWRLAIVLTQVLQGNGGIRGLAHVWFEFVQEMRFRWEQGMAIPGLLPGFPDPRTCLLHQKLQMLNCCIERKTAREAARRQSSTDIKSTSVEPDNSTTDDEDFYDALDEDVKRKSRCAGDDSDVFEDSVGTRHSLWDQPVGRLAIFEHKRLVQTGDPIYVPITQDPVPKTEDQLEEDTQLLLNLGSDAQGSELRARMMSASLLSDMESFKAANPGAILEDFIRWYSPRDWLENEDGAVDQWGQKCGKISDRMKISNNPWMEMWTASKPVPANRQKRLFDDTREAEKVLHFLNACSFMQIAELTVPVLVQAAICRAAAELATVSDVIGRSVELQSLIKMAERISRDYFDSKFVQPFVEQMAVLETNISQANSLLYKLNPAGGSFTEPTVNGIVKSVLDDTESPIEGTANSPVGKRLLAMFAEAQRSVAMLVGDNDHPLPPPALPAASQKEVVMRVSTHRPAAYSAKCPQYLRAILTRNDFRLVGAFTEDSVFF